MRLAERDRQVAALRDRDAVRERLGQVGELLRHLLLRHEVLPGREALRPARIGEHVPLRDAHAGLVGPEVVGAQELDRVRRDDRQPDLRGERDGRVDQRFLVRVTGSLHLEIAAAREAPLPGLRGRLRDHRVALQQRLADVAVARPGEHDQAFGTLVEPRRIDLGASAVLVAQVRAREPVAELEVAPPVGGQQQRAERRVTLGRVRGPDVAARDRLHPRVARGRVELHQPEEVGEIGERERRHPVVRRRAHGVVDAHGTVDDGELAVQPQVDERGGGHGSGGDDARILAR